MTKKQIPETKISKKDQLAGNRLIAEFMSKSFNMSHIGDYKNVPDEELPPMKYHTSWDWLMPVIEKIGDIYNQADIEMAARLMDSKKEIETTSIFCSIHVTYDRVIDFIKWYNNE